MSLDTITTPDGEERRLGCLVPDTFPTGFATFADSFQAEVLTADAVRAALAGKASMWGRRQRFAGKKYVRNQRSFGSCNGWSTAGMLSRQRELRGEPYVCLSGADAYSQMNGGRDQGSVLADGMRIVEANGIAPEDLVPANQIYTSQISAEAKAARARFKGFKTYAVDTELELASALVLGRVAVVAVHATNAFNQQDGDGVNRGGNGPGNHSVGVQDVRLGPDGTIQFDMVNSWDTDWCDGGHTWLTWERHLRETVKGHRFWVLVSTTDDPGDDSVPPPARG
jgi:hypothetical protein